MGFSVRDLFYYTVRVISSCTNISLGKRELFAYFTCLLVLYDVTVSILFPLLTVPRVGLQCMVVILAYFLVRHYVELVRHQHI